MSDAPIGIVDSGVGGLTVARSVLDQLPHEPVHQFMATGDPAAFQRLGRRFLGPEIGVVVGLGAR